MLDTHVRLSFSNRSKWDETIIFFKMGSEEGVDLKSNTATSIKGDLAPSMKPCMYVE